MRGRVYLVGMPGSGKSSVGLILAEALQVPFVDLDAEVEALAGRSIEHIFAEEGEGEFRDLERAAVARVASGGPAVVACGGGAVLDPGNRELLRSTGTVVFLWVGLETLRERLGPAPGRPVLRRPEDLDRLFAERQAWYRDVAHHEVDASGPAEAVAKAVREVLP